MRQLNYEQLDVVVSRFKNSIFRLSRSGDYPEEDRDAEILDILIDMKYEAKKKEKK